MTDEYVHVEEVQEVVNKLEERIDEIESDNRYQYEPADVRVNAPLALIQTGFESELGGLKKARNALEDLL